MSALDFAARAMAVQTRGNLRRLATLGPALRIAFAGDSIVAGASNGLAGERFASRSQRFRLAGTAAAPGGNFASGGARTDQIAGQLASVIGAGAKACVINGGVNDIAQSIAAATIKANLIANWNTLFNAGVMPVDFGMTPNSNTTRALAHADNELWRQIYCETHGIPHVQVWPQLANADGTWASGLGLDAVHPTALGNDRIADAVTDRIGNPSEVARFLELIDRSAGIGGNLLKNAVGFGGVQSGSVPSGYAASGSAGTPTYSVRAADANDFGNWLRCAFGGSTGGAFVGFAGTAVTLASLGWNVGDKVAVAFRIKAHTDAPGNLVLRCTAFGGGAGIRPLYDEPVAGDLDMYVYREYVVPASSNTPQLTITANALSAGSYVEINRPILYNLTLNGLA